MFETGTCNNLLLHEAKYFSWLFIKWNQKCDAKLPSNSILVIKNLRQDFLAQKTKEHLLAANHVTCWPYKHVNKKWFSLVGTSHSRNFRFLNRGWTFLVYRRIYQSVTFRFQNFSVSIFLIGFRFSIEKFDIKKSIGFGIVNIWYRKKYRYRLDFGYRHTLVDICANFR